MNISQNYPVFLQERVTDALNFCYDIPKYVYPDRVARMALQGGVIGVLYGIGSAVFSHFPHSEDSPWTESAVNTCVRNVVATGAVVGIMTSMKWMYKKEMIPLLHEREVHKLAQDQSNQNVILICRLVTRFKGPVEEFTAENIEQFKHFAHNHSIVLKPFCSQKEVVAALTAIQKKGKIIKGLWVCGLTYREFSEMWRSKIPENIRENFPEICSGNSSVSEEDMDKIVSVKHINR